MITTLSMPTTASIPSKDKAITNHAMARDGGAQPGRIGHSTSTKEHPKIKGKVKASGTVTMKIRTSKS